MVTALPTQLSQYFRIIALLNRGESVYSIVRTLGIKSLLVLPFPIRHLNRSKVVAWKTTITK